MFVDEQTLLTLSSEGNIPDDEGHIGKLRLHADPMLIIEFFLWRTRSEYAISNHSVRHCVWEEALRNKFLNKYNHAAIDEQIMFYQSDGLTKFDPSDPNNRLPSCSYTDVKFIFMSLV
ncbi:hypothetical protein Patl1_15909 [Pistacia atlantica]|uniref:Uncharacterized protein n=1 Tax=Pistacia atlantica TaxID=434234 RepID=A0ACC1B9Q2_9ROSI|nr:hypothetical protein Patl1_15909 [Pistacia atlantica]